ncbi:hypothetical protein ACOMHN_042652 [Nucella lapillus]
MAEGGVDSDSLRNNLCRNQEEKVEPEGKSIEQKSAFPELVPADAPDPSAFPGMINGFTHSTLDPIYCYSKHSETGLKDILEKAPPLSPAPSNVNISDKADQLSGTNPTTKIVNIDPVSLTPDREVKDQSLPAGACKQNRLDPEEEPASRSYEGGSSIVSSYLQAAFISQDSLSADSSSCASSQGEQKIPTNDLSAPNVPPPPHTFPFAHMSAAGFGSAMGGMMPMFYCPLPMSYGPAPMMPPQMMPYYMASSMGPSPVHMMHNISFGPHGMSGAAGGNGVTGGNGVNGGTPPGTLFGCYDSQGTLESRNIPVNNAGSAAPTSEENNCQGSRPYSINPGKSTQLTRLRDPVLQWIRRNLDRGCRNNWEAVADIRGWNYQDIRDHLEDCKRSRDSPFLKLLDTEAFCTYTVHDFLYDMERIGRSDILRDFDEVLDNKHKNKT